MANKKLIVSDGKGRYQETTSSFGVDDGVLSASAVILSTASYGSLVTPMSGILQVYNGKIMPLWFTSSVWENYDDDNNQLTEFLDKNFSKANLSGTLFQYRNDLKDYNGFGPHRVASASFSGDIIGTISSSVPVKVVSVQNVTGGILKPMYGGTGRSSFDVGKIATLSGSGYSITDLQNKIIISNINKNWSLQDKNTIESPFTPLTESIVYLFTGSVSQTSASTSTEFLWKKPPGTRFIRVMCQGGGASGGTQMSNYAGVGGGGGGFSEAMFDGINFTENEITIFAGNGGKAGAAARMNNNNKAGYGGTSSFGNYIYALPGYLLFNTSDNSSYGYSGSGYSYNGGDTNSMNVQFGGAAGGPGGYTATNTAGGKILLLNLTSSTTTNINKPLPGEGSKVFLFTKYYLNSTSSLSDQPFPLLSCAGPCGNTTGGNALSASFGSGGGGGASNGDGSGGTIYSAGNGGKGYVLIICS